MNGLMLHCGANAADMATVRAVALPEMTKSYCPIPHADLYDQVRGTLESSGLRVVEEAHGLWSGAQRYFGLMEVRNDGDFGLMVGLRNSHDKAFPAAIALGSRVFCCDNLSFSGEVKLSRKHTTHIWRDLPNLVQRAVAQLHDLKGIQTRRIETYKDRAIATDAVAHDLIVRAVDARVLPASKIMDVVQEWREPQHEEFRPRTAWSLFNGFTEILKGSLAQLPARTQALHGLMDMHCGLMLTVASSDETHVEMAV